MFETIVVGFDGTPEGEDALALARALAAPGGRIIAACQYWYEPVTARVGKSGPGPEAMRQDADGVLAAAPADVERRAVPGASPARALQGLAEEEEPDLIVLGSCHRGLRARALLGGTAERLLQGSPCPVAVAPRGHRDRAGAAPRRIVVGYCPEPEADMALLTARSIGRETGAEVTAVVAFNALAYAPMSPVMPAYNSWTEEARATVETDTAGHLAELLDGETVPTRTVEGDATAILRRSAEDADLLVMGSRAYGPVRRVIIGSVAHRLLAEGLSCAVLITPRGAEQPHHDAPAAAGAEASAV
jgi:nucleotide-binding universal stress UspA family protein